MPFYDFEYVYTTDSKEIKTTDNKVVVLTATPLGVGGGGSVVYYPSKKVKRDLELKLKGTKALPFFLAVSLVGTQAIIIEQILKVIGEIITQDVKNIDVLGISATIVKDQKTIEAILSKKVIKIDTLLGTVQNDFLGEYEVAGIAKKSLVSLRFMIGVKDMHPEVVKILIRTGEKEIKTMSSILGSKEFTVGLSKLVSGDVKKGDVNLKLGLQGKRDIRKIILSLFSID